MLMSLACEGEYRRSCCCCALRCTERLVESQGFRSVLDPLEKVGVLLGTHGGYPDEVVLPVADSGFGKRGQRYPRDAFRGAQAGLDRSRGASETQAAKPVKTHRSGLE